ncbi:MAG: adenylate/guanylate cyclase domain-containing protein [Bdellovibrionota bacterium]
MKTSNEKIVIENAIVGIVDMVSSTKLSNAVDVHTDWEIKERFLKAAQARAKQTGMSILSLTGDGFLFLANAKGGLEWARGLEAFQTLLVSDYRAILAEYAAVIGQVKSGIRFGVAAGPVIVGRVSGREDQFIAVGAAINLAARLCASAEIDQMAMSSSVWDVYGALNQDTEVSMCAHQQLKGFDHVIVGFHIRTQPEIASKRNTRTRVSARWTGFTLQQAA